MKLLELAKKNLQEYISVRETLELIAKTQQTPLSYVAIFLISQNFDTNIYTYDVDKFFIVESNDEFNWGVYQYTNSILSALADDEKYKGALKFNDSELPEILKNTYWKRKELYSLELIKNLSIDFYFRVPDIQIITQYTVYDSKEFDTKNSFSDADVRQLLKNGITGYQYGGTEKYNLIDDFVFSILCFFDYDFNHGYEISKNKLKQIFNKHKVVIKNFNDCLNEFESSFTNKIIPSINDENYLKIIEEELTYTPRIEVEVFNNHNKNTESNVIDLSLNEELNILIKSDYFDIFDSACLMSLDEPSKLNSDINYCDDWKYGEHKQAIKVLNYAIKARKLDEDEGLISRTSLQVFLFERGYIIKEFNDYLKDEATNQSLDNQNSIIDQFKNENEKLKAELLEKDQKIKELELIQTTVNESKLGNTRAENNVTKLLLVLAKIAEIDVSKPHAIHDSLLAQADLLGVDKFPSDETVKKWFIKANNHINN